MDEMKTSVLEVAGWSIGSWRTMKRHETRRYEVLLQLRPAETLPPAYEMDLPPTACLAEDGRETQAYDTAAQRSHLFGKPLGNIRLQLQVYEATTLALIVTETMEPVEETVTAATGEPVRLPSLAGRMPEAAWRLIVANDIDATVLDFCRLVIERMKMQAPVLAKLKNRLRADYCEFDEIYDPHYVRLEICLGWDWFFDPFATLGLPVEAEKPRRDPMQARKVVSATCTWKARDGSFVRRDVDVHQPMGLFLLEAYEAETKTPYRGALSVWQEHDPCGDDTYVFMKYGAAAGSKWAQAPERADAVVIPCEPGKIVYDYLPSVMKELRRANRRRLRRQRMQDC